MKVAVSRDCPTGVLFVKAPPPEQKHWDPFMRDLREEFPDYVVNWLIPFEVIVMTPRSAAHLDWSWATLP